MILLTKTRSRFVLIVWGVGLFYLLWGVIEVAQRGTLGVEGIWLGVYLLRFAPAFDRERLVAGARLPYEVRRRMILLFMTQFVPLYFLAYATRVVAYTSVSGHIVATYVILGAASLGVAF